MLPNGVILRSVAAEILPAMATGCLFVDCSTVDVISARDVAAEANTAGIEAVDAPVSGGTTGAAAGTLTFMAGGSDDGFARAVPLFDIMGSKTVHCGEAGAGQAAKICNNMILVIKHARMHADATDLLHSRPSFRCWIASQLCRHAFCVGGGQVTQVLGANKLIFVRSACFSVDAVLTLEAEPWRRPLAARQACQHIRGRAVWGVR